MRTPSTRTKSSALAGVSLALALACGTALAAHNEPLKGVLYKAFLMTAHAPCTTPDTMTSPPGLVLAACAAVRQDPVCGFGSKGVGKVTVKAIPGDVVVKATLAGLDAGCEGATLTLTVTSTSTTDDCGGEPNGCTVQDTLTTNVPIATCVVTDKRCIIKSTLNSFAPTSIEGGKRAGWEVQDVKVWRGGLNSFAAGILVP